ncbi:hybrid sensor histidine kinase/response regulator [Pseudomonas sp. TTU2014-080ASC]|uniref:hybrid sensor histidine kinase/response regulator n=1 Tax=Pseudomonas sp. TTU2014-080ASC TaxID=1729724 RepID=UPI0007189085|nr:7TM diverse intracellular signaling domain-containing protein [Pseudomonas sp. TTU2014-080ASC]KRW62772.1 histidine kinase [Pseudomonas sp. TTU2014-080ASC]
MPYIVLCLLLMLPVWAQAVVFDETTRVLPLGQKMMVFEDVRGDTTIEDVTSSTMQRQFRRHPVQTLNAGLSSSVFWVRVDLEYQPTGAGQTHPWWLVLSYPPLDDVRLYMADADGHFRLREQTGDTLPYSSRNIKRGNYVFELQLEPGRTQTVYLRIQTQGVLLVPLNLWSPKAYLEELPVWHYLLGGFFGILVVMTVYNLFIFISVRDISYLYYILYISSFGLYLMTLKGLSTELLWPESPAWVNMSMPFWIASSCLFGAQFVRKFLHMSEHSIWMDRFLIFMMTVSAIIMLMSLVADYRLPMLLATYLTLICTITGFICGVMAWLKGMRVARYFIIAWTAMLIGSLVSALMGIGVVPSNILTMNSSQIGCVLEVSLLSLALADRINGMKEERARILQETSIKLEALNRELADNNILKDQFLSTVTHELRTPMVGVLGSLELMQTEPMEPELAQYHRTASTSAKSMMGMVNDILHLTELQAGRRYPRHEPFSLRGLAEGLRLNYQQRASEKGLDFTVSVDEDLPDLFEGDASMIVQSVNCLLDNALKFTHSGWVHLSFGAGPGDAAAVPLLIEVTDSGVGFEVDGQDKLYQRFQQLDGSNSRAYGGLGIGLAICRQLVMLIGGKLSHDSRPGQGSRFVITLPNLVVPKKVEAVAASKNSGPVLRQPQDCTVLLVKANPVNRLLLRGMLLRLGYQVLCAESGEQALQMLSSGRIDAVLLDVQMPSMDGFATCRMLRQIPGCEMLPVLALTSHESRDSRARYVAAGMSDYLIKPVRFEQLRSSLNDWVLSRSG